MTAFAYRGVDAEGRPVRGRREAADEGALRDALVAERLTPLSIVRAAPTLGLGPGAGSAFTLSEAQAATLAADMSRFLASGLSLGQTLQIVGRTAETPRLARLAECLHEDLMAGAPLSGALQRVPGQTGRFLQSLARTGEATGRLTEILAGGAAALRANAALKRRLLTLIIYPAFVLTMAMAAILLFAFAVLPALEPAFAGVAARLPASTRAVLAGGRILRGAAPFLGLAAGAVVAALVLLPPARALARGAAERLLLTPLGLGVLRDTVFASLAQRLAVALRAGVPVANAFRVSADAVGVAPIRRALLAQEPRLREGAKCSDALRDCGYAPVLLVSLAQVGETAADLPRVLSEAGDTLSARAQERTERVLALVTPAVVLLVGLVVGSIVLVVFQGLLAISAAVDA